MCDRALRLLRAPLVVTLAALVVVGCGADGGGGPAATALSCGALTLVSVDGRSACIGAADAECPPDAPRAHTAHGLTVCVGDDAADAGSTAVVAAGLSDYCGPSGGAVADEDGAGCLFITVTGFSCPPLLSAMAAAGGWTACAPDADQAAALPAAFCAAAAEGGELVLGADGAACALAITVTGFDCPPPLVAIHRDAHMGLCGGPDLLPATVSELRDAYCAADGDGQYLDLDGQGGCARWITVTGFEPCPTHHPVARTAAPFALCAAELLDTGQAAGAREEVCRGEGALADIGQATLCTYAITVTGFVCPPLLSASTAAEGGATLCGREPGLTEPVVAEATAFAAAPYVCAWEGSVGGAFDQRLAGVGPTPAGTLLTGSVASLEPIALPGDTELATDSEHTLFAALLNVNGSLSDARIIGRGALGLYACGGMALDDAGRWYVAAAGRGLVTLGEGAAARDVDLGEGATVVARYDALGTLEEVMVATASDWPDRRYCAVGVDADGGVTLVHADDRSDQAEVVRFEADGGLAWRQPAPEGAAIEVASMAGGDFGLVGRFEGSVDVGGETLTAAALGDGWVARYDRAGELRWAGQLAGPDEDALAAIVAYRDDLIVAGHVSLDARWEAPEAPARAIADEAVDLNHLDAVVLRLDAAGEARWITRARGEGNNEGRALSVGLDGASVHLGGLSAAPVGFGSGDGAVGFEIDSTLFHYAGFVASFGLDDGRPATAWATSDTEPYFDAMWVVGHLDGTTTWAGNALGVGMYGVDPGARTQIGREINATIFLVHTPAAQCQ
ncbi:MAG: hypothetical protein CSA66_07640 [Proteobacteria bacterium]|nr:MAG: hypothetical protein CSA66_07640 [Pseudomonadota bacterium]